MYKNIFIFTFFRLLETLNDRMLQLKHQRKANKHIMTKLRDFESKLSEKDGEKAQLLLRPSSFLMKGYNAADVDLQLEENDILAAEENRAEILKQLNEFDSTPASTPDVRDLGQVFPSEFLKKVQKTPLNNTTFK